VIDIRLGAFSAAQVELLLCQLHGLLLADAEELGELEPNSRFLFVGSVSALAISEKESAKSRSVKRDAELAIRTLQNYGIAHYGHVGELGPEDSKSSDALLLSAMIGLARFYAKRDLIPVGQVLDEIAQDLSALVASARQLPEFTHLGIIDDDAGRAPGKPHLPWLLREMALLYQLGKGAPPAPFDPVTRLRELREHRELTFGALVPDSSYGLFVDLLSDLGEWAAAYSLAQDGRRGHQRADARTDMAGHAQSIAEMSFKLARYDLLRDFGRVLGQAALRRLRERGDAPQILIVDDDFFQSLKKRSGPRSKSRLIRGLKAAFGLAWKNASVVVVPSAFVDACTDLLTSDQGALLLDARVAEDAIDLDGNPSKAAIDLRSYLAVLIDPEAHADALGPIRVQRLASHLRQLAMEEQAVMGRAASKAGRQPPLIAFSRKESSGYVQQCLNMGAAAFVAKHRPYHLLFDLSRVLRSSRQHRLSTDKASQFRLLHALKPHVAAKLQRQDGPLYLFGGYRRRSGEFIGDTREKSWIAALPKADLHYHMGTAVRPAMVTLLAMNSAGHFLPPGPAQAGRKSTGGPVPLITRIARTVALTASLQGELLTGRQRVSAIELLAAAAASVVRDRKLENRAFALGDALIGHLVEPNDRCDHEHATALLVAMMGAREQFRIDSSVADFFRTLAAVPLRVNSSAATRKFSSRAALMLESRRAREHFAGVACRWSGSSTQGEFEALIGARPQSFWKLLRNGFERRVRTANDRLLRARRDACDWVESKEGAAARAAARDWLQAAGTASLPIQWTEDGALDLSRYSEIDKSGEQRGLARYLRGADLLGSAHFQYPENLWLAALAITEDNARENIIYSEIRCETTGYTKAGMGARDATEMLRHGFNLASLYWAGQPRKSGGGSRAGLNPLVRTNILLAAKRHKSEPAARAVVQLLQTYLERRPGSGDAAHSRRIYRKAFGRSLPAWWRPSDVVGFDISGDESKEPDWLGRVLEPLSALSSPVTIHAGEAASASSIWKAVYGLNALRIGHGLRLSEDIALLGYCVREGICMELCPNSNQFTNRFEPELTGRAKARPETQSLPRYEYPLLHYMHEGMEVTLGTDNRYLHCEGETTLSSEYLTAARLVGGLTRWEVLQIVKAGFKNAFLDKEEVRAIVQSVEKEIYRLLAADNV
jgi:adenosine deaminase